VHVTDEQTTVQAKEKYVLVRVAIIGINCSDSDSAQ